MLDLKWHQRFIELAQHVSAWSKDPSTKVGCVLVNPASWTIISTGFNGFPRGVKEVVDEIEYGHHGRPGFSKSDKLLPQRWERPTKYLYVEHAERNAIYNAARLGASTLGCYAYMNYEPTPCMDCARALIQAGVCVVIGPDIPFPGIGAGTCYELEKSREMLNEACVQRLVIPA